MPTKRCPILFILLQFFSPPTTFLSSQPSKLPCANLLKIGFCITAASWQPSNSPKIQHLDLCRHHYVSKVTGWKATVAANTESLHKKISVFRKECRESGWAPLLQREDAWGNMAQWGPVCQSGQKTVKAVLLIDFQREGEKKSLFDRGNYLAILSPPSCQHRRFPQGPPCFITRKWRKDSG